MHLPSTHTRILMLSIFFLLVAAPSGSALAARGAQADSDAARKDELPEDVLSVKHFMDMEQVASPQISPDGSQILYARSHVNKLKDRWDSELWILNADGSRHRFLAKGSAPRWSPDGTRIAYLAEGDPKGTQIFVRWMDAEGATSQVTRVEETPTTFRWSPDERLLAFVMLVPDTEKWEVGMPAEPEDAEWTKPPRMVTKTHYRQDRRGFMKEGFTHLFVVPSDGGTPRQLTEGAWNVGTRFSGLQFGAGIDWTPDGAEIVFDGLMDEEPENDGYAQSYLHAVDARTGKIRRIIAEKGYWSTPVVSPDGRQVAFTGYRFTLQSYKSSELHVSPLRGGKPRKIAGELDRDAQQLFWSADGRGVYFTAGDRGTQNVHYASLDGQMQQVTEGVHMLSLSSVSRGGTAAGTRTSYQLPGDVVRIDLKSNGQITRLTHVNDDVLGDKRLGEVQEVWYTSTEEVRVQGWVVKPPDFDASRRYPLILHIHGGPHAMYNVTFSYFFQNLAANGYVVLYTNPRGSTGYGTAFGNAIDKAYPGVDHDDLMAGVDELVERGFVDTDRLYVTGCSGGGVLSSWAIGQTDLFAAAAVRCPVTNWISFAGTADIVQWGYHRFDGYFWENPDKWLEHSPLMHVGNVTTPTLLMTGELDLRTPMSQTEEYYAALKVMGVETVMLRFNDEYHGTTRTPSNYMRTLLYLVDWFGKHAKGRLKP